MGDGFLLTEIGSPASIGSFFLLAAWIIRTWPHWKAKVNEARKIQLDADGVLRTDLLKRIHDLENAQSADRREFNEAISNERKRCDAELDAIRTRLAAAEEKERGLLSMIRQNSSSTAEMVSRPDAVAESNAGRKRREEDG